ncbi:MAG TPA: hypothetical protein DDY91_11470 [Planctomycetaceae bacterium]|nr:hypothetical protein [Planctomycetaceae bacterium]
MTLSTACVLAITFTFLSPASAQNFIQRAMVQDAAQEEETDDEDIPNAPNSGVVFGGIDESKFEARIWNGTVNSAAAGEARLQSQLDLQIAEIDRLCQLTEAQSQKLRLAGTSDIKRFFERYTKLRRQFLKVRNDQNLVNNFWGELQPLQMEIQSGLFNDESMLLRVVPKALDDAQRAIYEQETLDRRTFRMLARLELLLVAADESLGLMIDQRERLTELCKKHVRIPRRFGPYDSNVILYELSRIPEGEVREILDADQMQGWQQAVAQGRGMEQFLRQNKFLPEEEPARVIPKPEETSRQPKGEESIKDKPAVDGENQG